MSIKDLFRNPNWANQEVEYYDPKLLLTDEEIEQIKDRNRDNEDVQKLLGEIELLKKVLWEYEKL